MAAKKEVQLQINEIALRTITFNLLGTSALIMNRFNQKAWQELLLPSPRGNRAGREQSLKHNPPEEFRGAMYRNRSPDEPALIHMPNRAFHKALASAALDIPGATKAKIERLTQMPEINVNLFGIPHLFCAMVRNSDINRTPDVRTRPIFPQWACTVNITYVADILTERSLAHLMGAAGILIGIGDWRGERGGSYGKFTLVEEDNADFRQILRHQGSKAQKSAFETPIYFDDDTTELMNWFEGELQRREREPKKQPAKPTAKERHVTTHKNNGGEEGYIGKEPNV